MERNVRAATRRYTYLRGDWARFDAAFVLVEESAVLAPTLLGGGRSSTEREHTDQGIEITLACGSPACILKL